MFWCGLQSRADNNWINTVSCSCCWRCNANGRSPNALSFLPQRKCPMLRQESENLRFGGSNASFWLLPLFTQYETSWLAAISSDCLAALPAKDRVARSRWTKNAKLHIKICETASKNAKQAETGRWLSVLNYLDK